MGCKFSTGKTNVIKNHDTHINEMKFFKIFAVEKSKKLMNKTDWDSSDLQKLLQSFLPKINNETFMRKKVNDFKCESVYLYDRLYSVFLDP